MAWSPRFYAWRYLCSLSLYLLSLEVCSMYVLYHWLLGGWFSGTYPGFSVGQCQLTLSHFLFIQTVSLSPSWQNGCESGSIVWDGSWHGFRFHPSALYNHPHKACQWPMGASEDRGLEQAGTLGARPLGARHETVTALFFCQDYLSLWIFFSILIYSAVMPPPK